MDENKSSQTTSAGAQADTCSPPASPQSIFDSFFDSIKGDRQLSFSHWRYKLLHWAYGDSPASPSESKLPRFLYTHYCPLFHLTNLITLFLPLVFMAKVAWVFVCWGCWACNAIAGFLEPFVEKAIECHHQWRMRRRPSVEFENDHCLKSKKARELSKLPSIIRFCHSNGRDYDFDVLWVAFCKEFPSCSEEEVRAAYDECLEYHKTATELQKRRRDKMQAWVVFWVNFSRPLIKGVMNLAWLILALAVGYASIVYGIPAAILALSAVAWAVRELLAIEWMFVAILAVKVTVFTFASIVGVVLVVWLGKKVKFPFRWMAERVLFPCELAAGMAVAMSLYFRSTLLNAARFVSMFYEENCPPIVIVDDPEPLSSSEAT